MLEIRPFLDIKKHDKYFFCQQQSESVNIVAFDKSEHDTRIWYHGMAASKVCLQALSPFPPSQSTTQLPSLVDCFTPFFSPPPPLVQSLLQGYSFNLYSKACFHFWMSWISFAAKQRWTTLHMSRPLFVGSYMQVMWWALSQWKGKKICNKW